MPTFFHVSPEALNIGQILEPGHFGQRWLEIGQRGLHINEAIEFIWETALETARQAVAPDAPSRLNCIFTAKSVDDATAFRDRFRQGAHMYEVSCGDDTPAHEGNYDAITDPPPDGTPWLNFMPTSAISYWRDQPEGIVEVLIGGPVTVVRRL